LRVSAVVAAYNEEATLAEVLEALRRSPLIHEIVVVSDGSTDRTVEIARSFDDVTTIALRRNEGKGFAMRLGVEHASHDILFFVDGDMLNVTEEHIESLVGPVVRGECEMNIGVRHRGPLLDFFHLKLHFGPVLSGIRVMRRDVFSTVPRRYQERYKIEAALNFFCARAGLQQLDTVVRDLGHVTKERKRGVGAGLGARWIMTREVVLLLIDLYVLQIWRWIPHPQRKAEYEFYPAKGD
jgi:polyisoprenyl-phosphate glycosyltransferase